MTIRLLLVAFLLTGCNPYRQQADAAAADSRAPDGRAPDGGPRPDRPPPTETGTPSGWSSLLPPGAKVDFAKRGCEVTVRYSGQGQSVELAGSFTDWAKVPMTKTATGFELKLAPGPKLVSGKLYPYKLVVDGKWLVDRAAAYRAIDGSCMNSGLMMPDCEGGPELVAGKLAAAAAGTASVKVKALAAADGAALRELLASLDGKPLPAGAATLDAASGTVELKLAGLAQGKHRLRLRARDVKERDALEVELPFWIEPEPYDPRDGLLYMLFTDRFADGDGKRSSAGPGVEYPADWHGGDYAGALKVMQSGYFEKLGVRSIWLSPVNRQVDGHFIGRKDDTHQYSAYHGYWPIKAREVEPRFGGVAALRELVAEAHRRGIRVLVDLINNQVHEQHEYVAPHADWFRRPCVCDVDPGCGWSERPFDCLFHTYLPDINWLVPGAERQFVDDALYWLSELDLDGFRVDAVKHVEPNSIFNLRAEVARRFEQGGHRVWMFGETAIGPFEKYSFFCDSATNPKGGGDGYAWIDLYVGPTGLDGQFDFPTHNRVLGDGLVTGSASLVSVEEALAIAERDYQPGDLNVSFIGTQDSNRVASRAALDPSRNNRWGSDLPAPAYADAAVYRRIRRAFALALTAPGVPFLYNGDELAIPGGLDPDNRRNMRFTEPALAPLALAAPGKSPEPVTAEQQDLLAFMRALGSARAQTRAFSRGQRSTLVAEDDLLVYAWRAPSSTELGLVAINRGAAAVSKRKLQGTALAGVTSLALKAGSGDATLGGGAVELSLGAGEAAVFVGK